MIDKSKIIRFKTLVGPLSKQEMEAQILASNVRLTHSYQHFYKVEGANLYHKPFMSLKWKELK